MRYWFDTEFHEDGRTIELISIGIVREDGRTLHAVSADYDWNRATPWLVTNVLAHLRDDARHSRAAIKAAVEDFIADDTPQFWAYFGEYDWIVLRQLWGDMLSWPSGWPLLHLDVEQLRWSLGSPPLPAQSTTAHNALNDALWTRDSWRHLESLRAGGL